MTTDTTVNGAEPEEAEGIAPDLEAAASSAGKFIYQATAAFGALTLTILTASKLLRKYRESQQEERPAPGSAVIDPDEIAE